MTTPFIREGKPSNLALGFLQRWDHVGIHIVDEPSTLRVRGLSRWRVVHGVLSEVELLDWTSTHFPLRFRLEARPDDDSVVCTWSMQVETGAVFDDEALAEVEWHVRWRDPS